MAKVRKLAATGNLFLDFRFRGKRCREYTALPDNPANVKKLEKLASQIEAEIKFGTFDYAKSFPGSKNVAKFATGVQVTPTPIAASVARALTGSAPAIEFPTFNTFTDTWVAENEVAWRRSHPSGRLGFRAPAAAKRHRRRTSRR